MVKIIACVATHINYRGHRSPRLVSNTMASTERFDAFAVLVNREIGLRNAGERGSVPDDVLVRCMSSCKSTWLAHGGPGLASSIRNVSDSGVWTFVSDILALEHDDPIELSRRIAARASAHSDVHPRCYRHLQLTTLADLLCAGSVSFNDIDFETVSAATAIPSPDSCEREFALMYVLKTLHEASPLDVAALTSAFGLTFALQQVSDPWVKTREAGVSYISATCEWPLTASAVSLASENLRLACADGLTCDDIIEALHGEERPSNEWIRNALDFMLPQQPTKRAVAVLTSGLKRSLVVKGAWPAASVDDCCDSLGMLPYHALNCRNRLRTSPPSEAWWRRNGRRSAECALYAFDVLAALSDTFERGIALDLFFDLFGSNALTLLAIINRDDGRRPLAPRLLAATGLSLAETWAMVRERCGRECDAVAAMRLACELCNDMHRRYPLRDAIATLETSKMLRDARDDLNVFRLIALSERRYVTLSDTGRLCRSGRRRVCLINLLLRTNGRLAGRAGVDGVKRSVERFCREAKRACLA
jgi:hypothetical protein